jgi:hypothetical protein
MGRKLTGPRNNGLCFGPYLLEWAPTLSIVGCLPALFVGGRRRNTHDPRTRVGWPWTYRILTRSVASPSSAAAGHVKKQQRRATARATRRPAEKGRRNCLNWKRPESKPPHRQENPHPPAAPLPPPPLTSGPHAERGGDSDSEHASRPQPLRRGRRRRQPLLGEPKKKPSLSSSGIFPVCFGRSGALGCVSDEPPLFAW